MYLKYKVDAFRNNGNLIKTKTKKIYIHASIIIDFGLKNRKKQIFMLQF